MPYVMVRNHPKCKSGQVAVVKQGTDEVMGCHPNEVMAKRQMAALYASNPSEAHSGQGPSRKG